MNVGSGFKVSWKNPRALSIAVAAAIGRECFEGGTPVQVRPFGVSAK